MMTCKGLQAVKNAPLPRSVKRLQKALYMLKQAGLKVVLYDALLRRLTELGYCAGNADARPVCSTHARLLSVCIAW